MDNIIGVMRRVAEHEARRIFTTELGVVTTVFPHADEGDTDNYQCSVQLVNHVLPDGKGVELRRVPVATPYLGFAAIPAVGDLVLVNFIGGDANAPVITGRLYNDEDRPPPNQTGEILLQQTVAEGPSLRIDAQGSILLTSRNTENVVTINDETISLQNEKFSIVIDFSGEKISITSDKDLALTAANGTLTLEGKGVEIRSGADLKLEAKSGKCAVDAQEAEVKGTSGVKVQTSGSLALKGTTIEMN